MASRCRKTARKARLGFIATGMGTPYLKHVLADLGLDGVFPILHMGMSYPPDVTLVAELSERCGQMIVIEERRSFLEKNIRDACSAHFPRSGPARSSRASMAKQFRRACGSSRLARLNPSVLAQVLIPLIKATEEIPAEQRNGRLTAEMDASAQSEQAEAAGDLGRRSFRARHVLSRLPASRQLGDAAGTPQELRRPEIHEASIMAPARSIWSRTATPAATRC